MALWTPADITTALWLDASDSSTLFDATTGGSAVAADGEVKRIEDKSGNGLHLTSGGTSFPARKTNILNGFDVLRATLGTHVLRRLDTDVFRNATSGLMFSVIKASATNLANRVPLGVQVQSDGTSRLIQNLNNNNYRAAGRRLDADSGQSVTSSTTHNADWTIICVAVDWQSRSLVLRENGVVTASSSTFQTSGNTSDTQSMVSLMGFCIPSGTPYTANTFLGDFAEGVIIQGSLADAAKLEGYAAHRFGLAGSLPSDHLYKSAAPTTGTIQTRRRRDLGGYGL